MAKSSDYSVKSATLEIADSGRVALGDGAIEFYPPDASEKDVKVSHSAAAHQKKDDSKTRIE